MSTQFPNSRFNRSYLSKVVEANAAVKKPAGVVGNEGFGKPANDALRQDLLRRQQAVAAGKSVLEAFHPEIVRAISLLWGFPEMNEYFDRLWLADEAHGPIAPEAMSELMLLWRVHQTLVPQRPSRSMASLYGGNRGFETASGSARDPWRDIPPRR